MELKWRNLFKRRFKEQDVKEVIQKEKSQYYDIGPIDATNAVYRMIIGQRSNGKTYSVCRHMVEDYFKKGNRFRTYNVRARFYNRCFREVTEFQSLLLFVVDETYLYRAQRT